MSIAPKISNKSKNGTLSDSQIAKSVLLSNVGFNRERTNKRNVPNDADFNETRGLDAMFYVDENIRNFGNAGHAARFVSAFTQPFCLN